MEERDELEIETRLRAALQARSELVTHSTLRPGIPPNEHTAGLRARRDAWWSWRRLWVPVTVAAALAGGVFVGAQLPSGSDKSATSAAGGGPTAPNTAGGSVTASLTTSPGPTPDRGAAAGTPGTVGSIHLTLADGWQVTPLSATSGCVTPKTRPAPAADAGSDALPCGVDALYLKSDATPDTWPLSTASKAAGWWPGEAGSPSGITCPTAGPGSGNEVKNSVLLRTTAKYQLAAQPGQTTQLTADYHEWAVVCDTGPGVQPMLWKLNPASGTPASDTSAVATVVSADPQYDSALLGMVGSLHQAS